MSFSRTSLTIADLSRLSGSGRFEVVEGELITLAPASLSHGGIEFNASLIVGNFVRAHNLGRVFTGELGVILTAEPLTVRGADLAFYTTGRLPAGALPMEYASVVPDLVVEVVAKEDAADQVQRRVEEWLQAGVRMLWVLYAATKSIVVYRSLRDVRVLVGDDVLEGGDVLPGFAAPIAEFFV